MSRVFIQGDNAFVFGQRWYHLTGEDGERQEIRRYAKDAGASVRLATIIRTARGIACGFFLGQVPRMYKKRPLFSAAAVFAATCGSKNTLLTYSVDDVVAVIGIKDGLPDPDTDWVGELEDAIVVAQKFIQENGDRAFTVFDNAGVFTDAEPFDLATIDFDVQQKNLQVLSLSRSLIISLAIFLVVVGIPLVYYGFIQDYLIQKKRAEQARQSVDPVVAYLTSVRQALAEELPVSARKLGAAFEVIINAQPMNEQGWVLQAVECGQAGCSGVWGNRPWGTNENFLEDKNQATVQLSVGGTLIREKLPVRQNQADTQSKTPEEALPPFFEFLRRDISILQRYRMAGMNYTVNEAVPFGAKPGEKPPPGVPGGVIMRGEWRLDGPMGLFAEALEGLPDNMSLKSLTVKMSGEHIEGYSFVAEGYYYVRSR